MGFVNMKHKVTGKVESLPEHFLDHPVFGSQYERTNEDTNCVDCVLPEPEPAKVEILSVPKPPLEKIRKTSNG